MIIFTVFTAGALMFIGELCFEKCLDSICMFFWNVSKSSVLALLLTRLPYQSQQKGIISAVVLPEHKG